MSKSIGQRIEDWVLYGKPAEPFFADTRAEVTQFAASFEECPATRAELNDMSDSDLIDAAYWAMADYARGQM